MTGMRLTTAFAALALAALCLVTGRADAADPFGADACPGVRPGAVMQDPQQNAYTMGFFFSGANGRDKATYFSTVGDLVLPVVGTRTWSGTSGPAVRDADGKVIGHFVYAFRTDTPNADSFGLVRVDKGVTWSPSVCHFGGPTGMDKDSSLAPFEVQLYGQSLEFVGGNVVPARSAIAESSADPDQVTIIGPVDTFFSGLGDDGAPVLTTDGRAVGLLTTAATAGTQDGVEVRRLTPVVAKAAKATGLKLTLLTSHPM
jgi:hypothetical protein